MVVRGRRNDARVFGGLGFFPAVMAVVDGADLSALARLDPAASAVVDEGEALSVTLSLNQPVPWRVRLADDPAA